MGLHRYSIAARLVTLSAVALVFLIAGAAYGIYSISRINEAAMRQLQAGTLIVTAVDQARTAQVMFKKQVQEWKDILLRGNTPDSYAKYVALFQQEHAGVLSALEQLKAVARQLQFPVSAIDKAIATHVSLFDRYKGALQHFDPADATTGQKVDRLVVGIDREPTKAIDDIVEDINGRAANMRQEAVAAAQALYSQVRLLNLLGVSCGTALLIALATCIVRSIIGPLRRSLAYAEAVGHGRLDAVLDVSGTDETAVLAAAMGAMVESL
ncbi:MAG: HAMP domain-containing protein [Solidesulfovibrio sp. DCME]|uniref:HAMP domain-containing protein n=1 Tax=Solidesulfovibrio sp. DCME TaxID=3447380 RepID=UPI003D13E4B5